MRKLALVVMALASCRTAPQPKVQVATAPEGKDVLPDMQKMNAQAQQPPATFRPGHVTPHTLDASAISAKHGQFAVQFPARAPIVTPAVYDGKVLSSGGFRSRELYAFDARAGKLVWAIALDDDGPSSPACDDGVCVINTESCTIFAVEANTGKLLWSWWLGDPLMSSPTIAGGRVFTSYPASGPMGATHVLAAFDLKTGKVVWQKWIDADVMSAPVAVDGELYATTFAGTLYKFEQATGEIVTARRALATSAPVVVGGDVYYSRRADDGGRAGEAIVAQDRELKQGVRYEANKKAAVYLDPQVQARSTYSSSGKADDAANGFSSGAPTTANAGAAQALVGQGSVSTLQSFQGSRILHHHGRNVSSMGDEVVATDPKSGAKLWSKKLDGDVAQDGGFLAAPPIAAGDSVFVATLKGEIIRLDPKSGAEKGRWKVGSPIRSQPVIEAGWIYVGTQDGRLVALDTGDRSLSGWPQWGKNPARTGAN